MIFQYEDCGTLNLGCIMSNQGYHEAINEPTEETSNL